MKTPKKNLTIRLDPDELEWLEGEAKRQVRSVAGLVRWLIAQYREKEN
ncbi:ribbon-helix-helix protein, CopG family [Dethiosulfovibrio salsuginis]